jgi:hypothetical protein
MHNNNKERKEKRKGEMILITFLTLSTKMDPTRQPLSGNIKIS